MDLAAFPVQALIGVAVVGALVLLTALALSACLKRRADADSLFWYGFTGLIAIVIAIAAAAATVPGSEGLVTAAALVSMGAAAGWLWRGEHERGVRRREATLAQERDALRNRHEAALQQWVSYELDPANTIDFPAMTDLSQRETSQLIRAMRVAALARTRFDDGAGAAEYEPAVSGLEAALRAAEFSAGVVPGESTPRRRTHPGAGH